MKKIIYLFIFIFCTSISFAQIAPGKYFVEFTDKNNSPYSIGNPGEYLSQRSIDRRIRQMIPVDIKDLPVNPSYIQAVKDIGVVILNPTKWLNGVTIETSDPNKIAQINALPFVNAIIDSPVTPGDKKFVKSFFANEAYDLTWNGSYNSNINRSFDYGPSYNQIHMLRGDELHDLGYRGEGIVIAVLDAGFENANTIAAFDSLWDNNQVLGSWDFVNRSPMTFNKHSHGTYVLSTMGGNVPGTLIGTAPKSSYWLFRSEDGGSEYLIEEYNWVSAAEYADSVGADVINSSLGYYEFNDPSQNHTYADMNGITTPVSIGADIAVTRGIAVVNSAGNEGGSSWQHIIAPSDGINVLCIGAVDANGIRVGFSSIGPSYDNRVKPNVMAQGLNAYAADPYGFYFGVSGTSFSSPITAGMVACLLQANYLKTVYALFDAIEKSASMYTTPDEFMGYGIPDFMAANQLLTIIEEDAFSSADIRIYPNPFNDYIYINFENVSGSITNIEILDILGKVIYKKAVNEDDKILFMNDLSVIKSGVYFVRAINDSNITVTKRIIRK